MPRFILERQSGVLSDTQSPLQHTFLCGQLVLSKPKEQTWLLYQMFSDAQGFEMGGKGTGKRKKENQKKKREKQCQDSVFCDSVSCLHLKLLQYWCPLLCHVCTSLTPKKAKQVSTSPGSQETRFLNFHLFSIFNSETLRALYCQELVNRSILMW